MSDVFKKMAFQKMKAEVKKGLREGLSSVIPSGLTPAEIKSSGPDLMTMLREASTEALNEFEEEAMMQLAKG